MPVMPFLSRRRSAFDVITANMRDNAKDDETIQRPTTSSLAVPSPTGSRPARPISVYGMAFASSRLSHEVRREDIPDSPTHASTRRRSKRFSMLKMRNFSESQLSFRTQTEAEDVPPMPALPALQQTPSITRTGPAAGTDGLEQAEPKAAGISFMRPVSRKRDTSFGAPRKSVDEKERPKKSSLRWRKKQGKSTGLDDLIALSSARTKQPEAPPAYGNEDNTELALPVPRFSESSRSDGSHASSGDHIYGSTTTTTHTVSTHTTFFRLPRRNKNRNSLFPLPDRPASPVSAVLDEPTTPHASDPHDTRSPPLTTLHRANTSGSPTKRTTIIAPHGNPMHSSFTNVLQTGQSLARRASQRSRNSSTSSPLQPPMRLGLRNRASTTSSFGRGSIDTPPLPSGSTRNSTSTTGRSSLGGLLSLTRFRQDSDANSPGTRSKSNSFAISREALVIPEREDGDTPGKYLEKLESTVSRSMIATILSKSSDPFSQAVLRSYTRRFPFFGEPIDMSLRKFLLEAELPKETQQVDRVIQAFADRYHECNPGVFVSPDQAYIIAFSLMMLHTDAFNKNNKRKMQKQDYIKNTSGQRVSDDVLGCFYDNICYTPFVHYEEEVDINGERVLPFKPKKIKMKATAVDAAKKPSGPVDPYNLLVEQKLDALRPSIRDSIVIEDPYNYLGGQNNLDMKSLQRAFTHTGVLQIISARSRPTAYESHFNNAGSIPAETEAGIISLKITKVGTLWRKATKKKKARSPWQEWGAVLTGSQLYLFKNAHWAKGLLHQFVSQQKPGGQRMPVTFKPPLTEFKPDALIKTDDAVALVDSTYTRHKHSFTFVRHGGQEEVFLADSDTDRNDWLALINYAAAFRAAGVRIRGMLGVNDDDARTSRRASATSGTSASHQIVDVDAANARRLDAQLTKQVMAARRQIMVQRIVEADRDVSSMTQQLDDLLRDARHLTVLAPIAAKTREDVIFAAARADANIKWIRRDIWRVKAHRDIIALDVQEDGIDANELRTMVDKAAEIEQTTDDGSRLGGTISQRIAARPSTDAFTALSRTGSVREAVDDFVDDVFRAPHESAKAAQSGGWRLPPLQLDVTEEDKKHRASIASTMLSVPEPSSGRPSFSQGSSAGQRPELLATPSAAAVALATTPSSSAVDTDTDIQTVRSVISEPTTMPPPLDGASKAASPESTSKQRSVRRSLQKTLREVQHHQPTLHKHRRGKESESTVRSKAEAEDEQQEGTPGLERAKGRFILHGKQASVIEFGEDWPNERMKMRREAWRNAPRTPRGTERPSRRPTMEDGQRSPVVQELVHDTTDDEGTDSNTLDDSAAHSFVESAELAQQYSVGSPQATPADEDSSDDERPFYDLSSWDTDVGKRDTIVGPDVDEREERLDAINEHSDDGNDTTGTSALHGKGDRRTVIGPSAKAKDISHESNDDWLSKSFEPVGQKAAVA